MASVGSIISIDFTTSEIDSPDSSGHGHPRPTNHWQWPL